MRKPLICTILLLALPMAAHATLLWTAYNDCVYAGEPSVNTTIYSGHLGGGGGFEDPDGYLKDSATGSYTSVLATLSAYNVSGSTGIMPNAGTPAHSAFNGFVNMGGSASYGDSTYGWWYQVVFTGLDPTKTYGFVTTANRGSSYTPPRWSKFSITGADAYTNASTAGTIQVTPDVVHINGGANTVAGDIVAWEGITAADGSFTVRSENLRDINGKPYGYGMQAFRLQEFESSASAVPEPASCALLALAVGGIGAMLRKRRRS